MRVQRFDLLRYGKFTDRVLDFPQSACDFHLVVGPNEAGKSTFRKAVLDLLFGFHPRTPLDFLHPKSDLRVAASIEQDGRSLDFIRVKGNKNTLRAPDETPLPDTALDVFLGGSTRVFFDKMFGLDHPRLVEGGNSILNAQDDIGQLLFQAAAGLAGLGRVRDALHQEADSLWAPARSGKRAYYIARERLDTATAALKAATVRTRQWTELHERVTALEGSVQAARDAHLARHATKTRLERIRRVRPLVLELLEAEKALCALGQPTLLPQDAAVMLDKAERQQAMAHQLLDVRQAEIARLAAQHAGLEVDELILPLADTIEALEALRHQYTSHPAAILRCQGQASALWQDVLQSVLELKWNSGDFSFPAEPSDAAISALRLRLPGLPARRQMEQLLQEHGAVVQALDSALAALAGRQAETRSLQDKLHGMAMPETNPSLRALVEQISGRGDPVAAWHKATQAWDAAQAALEHALARLGPWRRAFDDLRAQVCPAAQSVSAALTERQALASEARVSDRECAELEARVARSAAEVNQYKELHHPITHGEVLLARGARDATWQEIKSGRQSIACLAADFESRVAEADRVADVRHDHASREAGLHALQQALQQETHKLADARQQAVASRQALEDLDEQWRERCKAAGLTGMALEQLPDWLVQKERALDAGQALLLAAQARQSLLSEQSQSCRALRQALGDASLAPLPDYANDGPESLAGLRRQAQSAIAETDAAKVRYEAWQAQAAQAQPVLRAAEQQVQIAEARLQTWRDAWRDALESTGLAPELAPAAAQGALSVAATIAERLTQLRQLRNDRISTMQAQLQDYIGQVVQLARAAGHEGPGSTAVTIEEAFSLGQVLSRRLAAARQMQQERMRTSQALARETAAASEAQQTIAECRAALQPLMAAAAVDDTSALLAAIARSDRCRALTLKVEQLLGSILQAGDGYSREEIQSEVDAADPSALMVQLEALQTELEEGAERQSQLAVQLDQARRELDAIGGSDEAARAEAGRQEALADMGVAAERYIKVRTAERLLRWAIDRYREEKQGPMLSHASSVFSGLTLGAFERLRVDFDAQPMVLEGQRADGRCVGISGLSDGTRDQLFMALRLAALQLHLQQGPALPFIADDLFINFDDARAMAGLEALKALSRHTQVVFLTHHDHLTDLARQVFGRALNVVAL